jgi:hypothetical protein
VPEWREIPEFVSFFAPFFLPKLVQDGYLLKEYVRSEEFAGVRQRAGDASVVDAFFAKALALSWNNTYEALLISFIATMDHRNFGVRLPIMGPLIWVPLTSEFPEDFDSRVAALPGNLYPDSPGGHGGDRDKLQHFFGSAFLSHVCESAEPAGRMGELIEAGEELFVVDGALDERDRRANEQGQSFGLGLLRDKSLRPSRFLSFVLADREVPDVRQDRISRTGCVPQMCADPLLEDR